MAPSLFVDEGKARGQQIEEGRDGEARCDERNELVASSSSRSSSNDAGGGHERDGLESSCKERTRERERSDLLEVESEGEEDGERETNWRSKVRKASR